MTKTRPNRALQRETRARAAYEGLTYCQALALIRAEQAELANFGTDDSSMQIIAVPGGAIDMTDGSNEGRAR